MVKGGGCGAAQQVDSRRGSNSKLLHEKREKEEWREDEVLIFDP
jgi:hypothetical protein